MPIRPASWLPYSVVIPRFRSVRFLLETHLHDLGDILRESLANESDALAAYYQLLELTQGKSVLLEDYARSLIVQEEMHADEVNKMLRRAGKQACMSLRDSRKAVRRPRSLNPS